MNNNYAVVVTAAGNYPQHTGLDVPCAVGDVINSIVVDPIANPPEAGLSYVLMTDILNSQFTKKIQKLFPQTIPPIPSTVAAEGIPPTVEQLQTQITDIQAQLNTMSTAASPAVTKTTVSG